MPCSKGDDLFVCQIPDDNIWLIGVILPVIPMFGLPNGQSNEQCFHKCIGFRFRNESDLSLELNLKQARLQQGGKEMSIVSVRKRLRGTLLDAEKASPESTDLEPGDSIELYFRGFKRGDEAAILKGLQYCRSGSCKEFAMKQIRIENQWRIVFASMNGGWNIDL